MEIGAISNIYLLIFIPLFSLLLCHLFCFKNSGFYIALFAILVLILLIAKIGPDILIYEKIKNDYELSLLSLGLEFSLDLIGFVFLVLILGLEFLVLIFYKRDIENSLDIRNQSNFYAIFLLKIFSLIGIITANNLFNLYIYIEIHSFAFFTISTISRNHKLLNISFGSFCLSSAASILILICFFTIYLTFGELNFDKIADNLLLLPLDQAWFLLIILILFSLALLIKFFPMWQYFEKVKSTSLVASFLTIDAFFVRVLIGLFLMLKFIYFFFGNKFLFTRFEFSSIGVLIGFALVMFGSIKLIKERHLKLICIFSAISSIGFIIATIAMQSIESMQAMFFFLLNFSAINFFMFLFASYMKKNFHSSSIYKISEIVSAGNISMVPIKLLILFIAGLPFSFVFFGYWHLTLASIGFDIKIIMIIAMIFSNYAQLNIVTRIIESILRGYKEDKNHHKKTLQNNNLQSFCLWLLIIMIYIGAFSSESLNNIAFRFASFLLINTI